MYSSDTFTCANRKHRFVAKRIFYAQTKIKYNEFYMVFTLFTLNAYLWLLELFWVGWQRGIWFWSGPDLWELKELNGPELSPQLSQTSSEGRYDLGEGEGDELCGRDALEDVSDLEGAFLTSLGCWTGAPRWVSRQDNRISEIASLRILWNLFHFTFQSFLGDLITQTKMASSSASLTWQQL